jgi:hypothetical protein
LAIVAGILIGLGILIGVYRYYWPESIESISRKWAESTHSDVTSESFTHWDEDDPPLIPSGCAKCHSTYGYRDFLGTDGSTPRRVDERAETGTVVYCSACHNDPAHEMTSVEFPSDVVIDQLGHEAICIQCHQGRRSTGYVQQAVVGYPDDRVVDQLEFINVHYQVAAATLFGGEVRGGYQYADRGYVDRFEHQATVETCVDCHDPHSQRIVVGECTPCHVAVVGYEDLRSIRTSAPDYDGDGDTNEGIAMEIEALHGMVYAALQAYARQVIGTPLIYADQFPYFFVDTDGDGEADEGETGFNNQYTRWTPRLVRTAYNYHYVHQDPGAFVHNGRYVLQLLHDSLADLDEEVDTGLESLTRPVGEEE